MLHPIFAMRTGFAQQYVQQETLAILAVLLAALLAVTAAAADPGWQELQRDRLA